MNRTEYNTPMEFEYDNKQAQVPANSLWMTGTKTLQNNNFGSPKKINMAFQASKMQNTLPQTPIKNHIAQFRDTPGFDFSSGGENPSSPELADNDDTPDGPLRTLNANVAVSRGTNHSPSKTTSRPVSPTKFNIRTSLSNAFSKFSPSHKALVQKDVARRTKAMDRPHKRKRRDLEQENTVESEAEYDTDGMQVAAFKTPGHSPRKASRSTAEPPPVELGTIPAILKFIHDHPGLPQIISWYAQMLVSSLLMIGVVYVLYSFWSAIQRDIDLKAEELSQDLLREIGLCSENFMGHNCMSRENLGLKFKILCDEWETCMKQDHRAVGRAKISASTWAEILNGFVEPLSGKIIFLGVALFTIATIVPHILFGLIRKADTNYQPNPPNRNANNDYNGNPMDTLYRTPMHTRNYDPFDDRGLTSGRRSPSKEHRGLEHRSPMRSIQYP